MLDFVIVLSLLLLFMSLDFVTVSVVVVELQVVVLGHMAVLLDRTRNYIYDADIKFKAESS